MLSRRHLRIKALQSLYAYYQSDPGDIDRCEKELFFSIERMYDLYLSLLLFVPEVYEYGHTGSIPENKVITQLFSAEGFSSGIKERGINWTGDDKETVRKTWRHLKKEQEYKDYFSLQEHSYEADKSFLMWLIKNTLTRSAMLDHYVEEKSIYWIQEHRFITAMAIKTFRAFTDKMEPAPAIFPLYKDVEEDQVFVRNLYRKTIQFGNEYEKLIAAKARNWELDRIALMDIILMKMALAEIINFPNIPIKVSINEYIEISKEYSTPKSRLFINGVVDKLVNDFKGEDKIRKSGRGLIE